MGLRQWAYSQPVATFLVGAAAKGTPRPSTARFKIVSIASQCAEKLHSRKTDGSREWNASDGIRLREAEGNEEGATEQDEFEVMDNNRQKSSALGDGMAVEEPSSDGGDHRD